MPSLEINQSQKALQTLTLSPRMIQSMEILQLSMPELQERIRQELESNPLLERLDVSGEADGRGRDGPTGVRTVDSSPPAPTGGRQAEPTANGEPTDGFQKLADITGQFADYGEYLRSGGYLGREQFRSGGNGESDGDRDRKLDAMANTAARPAGLHDLLLEQLGFLDSTPTVRRLAEAVIAHLEPSGYLKTPLGEVIASVGLDPAVPTVAAEAEQALALVQKLDPPGVGARDLRECLLCQLDRLADEADANARHDKHDKHDKHDNVGKHDKHDKHNNLDKHDKQVEPAEAAEPLTAARLIVANHLDDLANNRLPAISKRTRLTLEQIEAAVQLIRTQLNPRPGGQVDEAPAPTITPDVLIEYDETADEYTVRLADDLYPSLTVNEGYQKMARGAGHAGSAHAGSAHAGSAHAGSAHSGSVHAGSAHAGSAHAGSGVHPVNGVEHKHEPNGSSAGTHTSTHAGGHVDGSTRDFLARKLRDARWLLSSIEQRRTTLLRVARKLVEHQRDYIAHGAGHLKPLPMTQVADELGIHVGTVSRAVSEKYAATPRGLVSLRSFFTGGTQNANGQDIAWDAVRAKLQEIINSEDKSQPLSDGDIVDRLKDQGIELARRTVAKYRTLLRIPAARRRRQYRT